MAVYLTVAGGVTMAAGWSILRLADGTIDLTIRAQTLLGAAVGMAVALLNIFIVARLMFVSTAHDLRLLVALIGFSAVASCCFGLRVAALIVRRVQVIAAAIAALAAGEYEATVQVSGGDEIRRLADDVNSLAARLQAGAEQRRAVERERRELTAAISHDLRTPLASIRAMVEALDDRVVEDQPEIARYYSTIRREIERLSRLIDDLFELARLDAGALQLDLHPVALQEIAAEVVDAMQAQARRAGITLALQTDAMPAELLLDGGRMERALGNLVRNALQHTPPGGRVEVDVSVGEGDGRAVLSVRDTGEGIEAALLPLVWERSYRGERPRGALDSEGAGLGLTIVRGIVEAHAGTVAVQSTPGHGSLFTVRLPRQERSDPLAPTGPQI